MSRHTFDIVSSVPSLDLVHACIARIHPHQSATSSERLNRGRHELPCVCVCVAAFASSSDTTSHANLVLE
eukprot:1835517-Prymnesium_polylepis.2